MLRVERLSAEAQQAARAIAVGRRLDQATIGEATGLASAALQAALREAVAEQVLVAGEDGHILFRHALLREVVYDDLLPGERSDFHLALTHALEQRSSDADHRDVERAATVAGHYAAAGDQSAALCASIEAARAAACVHAYGEAADLSERALELWPRVPDAQSAAAMSHVELLDFAARMHGIGADRARAEVLWRNALEQLDEREDAAGYAHVLARLARIQWALNRGVEALETAQRALALIGEDGDATIERTAILSWLARTRFLRGRFRDAIADGEQALAAAVAVDDPQSESEVLNTLGMAKIALGRVEEGVAHLRRAIHLARTEDNVDGLAHAYSNLADMLNLRGRAEEGLEVAREGLAALPPRLGTGRDWMELTISELSFELGRWDEARAHLGDLPAHHAGTQLIFRLTREADLALGEGDEDRAERALDEVAPLIEASSEPQWIGLVGALPATCAAGSATSRPRARR